MILFKSITCLSIGSLIFLVCSWHGLRGPLNSIQPDNVASLSRSELKPAALEELLGDMAPKEQGEKDPKCPRHTAPCEAFWLSRVVFIGKVEKIDPIIQGSSRNTTAKSKSKQQQFIRIQFSVEITYRGDPGANAEVQARVKHLGSPEFKLGERYLVYASTLFKDFNPSFIEACRRTKLLAKAKEDLDFIAGIPKLDSEIFDATDGLYAISMDRPVYPKKARKAGIAGNLFVRIIVDETGKVTMAHCVCGPAALIPAAEKAARTWRYHPTLLHGKPVKVSIVVPFRFEL